jgi:Sortilin, neurotensin receptor 3,
MNPAVVFLISFIGVALLYINNYKQQATSQKIITFYFKFTPIFFLCIVNIATAQIKPSTAAERLNGLQKRKLLQDKSILSNLKFRNIGPTQMNGRVVDIEVNPADPTEFYLAYASGGLWHTANNGLSFNPLFEKEDAYSIGDIAVNWQTKTIWVGTGEVNSSRSSYSGIGVFKSTDMGKTWQYMGLPESHHIGKIILHPTNDKIAYVAALGHLYSANKERGVYKTIDGGITWSQSLFVDDNTGAVEMDINPQNPNELYACMWYRTRRAWDFEPSGKSSGIYKSVDGGAHWNLITTPTSGFPSGFGVGRSGIAVYAKNPQIVYAVVDNNFVKPDTSTKKIDTSVYTNETFKNITKENFLLLNNNKLDTFLMENDLPEKYTPTVIKEMVASNKIKPSAVYDWVVADDGFQNAGIYGCEIYKSIDGGINWKKTNQKDIKVYSSYGYYFGKIFVSQADENKVVTFGTSIIFSNDGGKSFTAVDKDNTHGDWHSCWINPVKDNHWIAVNDGGCNITYDNGKKWFKVTSIPAGQFYGITTDNAKPYHVFGGLQDNGTWMGASKQANNNMGFSFAKAGVEVDPEEYDWRAIGGGDGMQVQVDSRDNATAYTGFQFGYYSRTNITGGKRISIHPMHELGETQKLRYNWQTPILLSKHNQEVFYYGSNKLHRSLTKGENLVAITGDLTNGKKVGKIPYGTITTIAESPIKFGLLYVGTDDGNVQVSKDGGYTFVNIGKNLPQNLWVSRVAASAHKEGRVYVTLNGYRYDNFTPWLFVSEDYGTTWQNIGADLPAEPLNVVKEDLKNENIIYVGSDNGLYVSFNKGNKFMSMGNQLPRVPIHDLVIQERENELVVGTHGRSIYVTQLDSVYKFFEKENKLKTMQASLKQFDAKQMNEGEAAIDCPPARPSKKKKKQSVVIVNASN